MIRIFKNNNLHIKLDREEKEKATDQNILEIFLYNYDFCPVSEEYCISNYMTAFDVEYNGGWNYYKVIMSNLDDLMQGKTIILKPFNSKYINEYILPYLDD